MSNPGVITLANGSSNKGNIKRFVVEDNIGESIHLHIDNMRVDFTIDEFLTFSETIRESLDSIDFLCGYKLSQFDEHFLKECSSHLPRLKKIEIEIIINNKPTVLLNHPSGSVAHFNLLINLLPRKAIRPNINPRPNMYQIK